MATDSEKTEQERRRFPFGKALLIVAALLLLLLPTVLFKPANGVLELGDATYKLDIASTDEARKQGLSGRESMARDAGMVFVFDEVGPQCFWMKDMQFPIDIIWLNEDKKVVHIERDVAPDTYPEQFCPSEPAKYVIELNAGQANSVKTGQTLSF